MVYSKHKLPTGTAAFYFSLGVGVSIDQGDAAPEINSTLMRAAAGSRQEHMWYGVGGRGELCVMKPDYQKMGQEPEKTAMFVHSCKFKVRVL